MPIRIVRLGTPRAGDEGPRLGTVRRPPRGVPKEKFAALDYYDAWLPNLAPSAELMQWARAEAIHSDKGWAAFARRYRAEMAAAASTHVLDALAALSHGANFSVGCYCEDARRCHRSVLRTLLAERGAAIRPGSD
jgi:uncharacterized protein YeaO (DUF488 family)